MIANLKILPTDILNDYEKQIDPNLEQKFNDLKEAEISTDSFSFYTSVSSVFSSKIEGEDIDIDSYIKHKKYGIEFLPDYTQKIDDLYTAYKFAASHPLCEENIEEAHKLLSKQFLANHLRGKIRNQNMFVSTSDGKIEFVAASPFQVKDEMAKLYQDIEILLETTLNFNECFYFASMIHLVFVKIHPWNDGNGRSARLLEKWFLSEKLGVNAWFVQSEKYYYLQHQNYYNNIRILGLEYDYLDYSKALPFLLMLPSSLKIDL